MISTQKTLLASVMATALVATTLTLADSRPGPGPMGDCDGAGKGHHMERGFGGPGFHGGLGFMDERHLARMGEKLGLSEEQKTKIQQIVDSAKESGEPLRKAMFENRRAEREAMHAGADEKTLRKLARKSADARVDLMVHGMGVKNQIESVLTGEQRQQWTEMKEARMQRMEERMEKHHQGAAQE